MSFQWPWQYDFPPFFTLQPNLLTREKQLEAWATLVIDYCQFYKIFTVELSDIQQTELFCNFKHNRKLSEEGVRAIFDFLELKKHVEWLDRHKNSCRIYWRTPEEWAKLIYDWIVSNGMLNTVCTLYELIQGEDTVGESFHELDKEVLLKALKHLQSQRRAELIVINDNEGVNCRENVNEGDTVIVYVNFCSTYAITVHRGHTLTMKYGALRHEYLIGKKYGSRISATAGYVYILRASPELWTRALPHRTQILYTADVALITSLLDLHPGCIVLESGTGSGSLTHALARTVAPNGRVVSIESDPERARAVDIQLQLHGLADVVQVRSADIESFEDVFDADAVMLDLPRPWSAIPFARRVLTRRGGRVVTFSPCIEQAQRATETLAGQGFIQVCTVELIPRSFKVIDVGEQSLSDFDSGQSAPTGLHGKVVPFPVKQPTHTGYLTSATLLSTSC